MTASDLLLAGLASKLEAVISGRRWKRTAFAHGRVSRNTVRNVLDGKDHRLSTLIELADALECELLIDIRPKSKAQDTAHE